MPAHGAIVRFLVVAVAMTAGLPAGAQSIPQPGPKAGADAKGADTQAAEAAKAFQSGMAAFEGGKNGEAILAMSAAIASGKLNNSELAKALFYRGVAQRRDKKPGAALSDLNAAVWLRDGLSATDKAVAEDHRQALLREVAGGSGDPPPAVAAAPESPSAPVAAPVPAPVVTAASAPPPSAPVAAQPALPWSTSEPVAPVAITQEPPPPVQERVAVVDEKPLPWATPAAPADPTTPAVPTTPALPDTVSDPVASVATVERGPIETVHAEPAPPEKPLPWQMAAVAPATPVELAAPPVAPPVSPVPAETPAVADAVEVKPDAAAALPSAAPIPPAETADAPSAIASAGQAASSFFGSLFNGGGEPAAAASPPEATTVAVAEVAPAEAAPPVASTWTVKTDAAPAATPMETASISKPVETPHAQDAVWGPETTTAAPAPAQPPQSIKVAAAAPVEPATPARDEPVPAPVTAPIAAAPPLEPALPARTALPGPFRLQIAAENSREDAEQTLAKLRSQHGLSLRGLEPVIEEPATGGVLFGSMGSAYRVSIGPYTQSAEAGRLCNILKPHGFECRVTEVAP